MNIQRIVKIGAGLLGVLGIVFLLESSELAMKKLKWLLLWETMEQYRH